MAAKVRRALQWKCGICRLSITPEQPVSASVKGQARSSSQSFRFHPMCILPRLQLEKVRAGANECCFCGQSIFRQGPDPCLIDWTLDPHDDGLTGRCHASCLRGVVHPSIHVEVTDEDTASS
jgi:hypothetical protein